MESITPAPPLVPLSDGGSTGTKASTTGSHHNSSGNGFAKALDNAATAQHHDGEHHEVGKGDANTAKSAGRTDGKVDKRHEKDDDTAGKQDKTTADDSADSPSSNNSTSAADSANAASANNSTSATGNGADPAAIAIMNAQNSLVPGEVLQAVTPQAIVASPTAPSPQVSASSISKLGSQPTAVATTMATSTSTSPSLATVSAPDQPVQSGQQGQPVLLGQQGQPGQAGQQGQQGLPGQQAQPVQPGVKAGAATDNTTAGPNSTPDLLSLMTQIMAPTTSAAKQVKATDTKDSATSTSIAGVDSTATKNALDLLTTAPKIDATQNLADFKTVAALATPTPASTLKQVVDVVLPLSRQGNGDYQVTMQLRPENLGPVEVNVTFNNGEISMQLSSQNADARQLMRDGMNDLRSQLESSGLQTGSLDVGSRNSNQTNDNSRNNGKNTSATRGITQLDDDNFLARVAPFISTQLAEGPLDVRI